MEASRQLGEEQPSLLLQALHASGLPLTQSLIQAEQMGVPPEDQLRFAAGRIPALLGIPPEEHPVHRDRHLLLASIMVLGCSHPSPTELQEAFDRAAGRSSLLVQAFDDRFTGDGRATAHVMAMVLRSASCPLNVADVMRFLDQERERKWMRERIPFLVKARWGTQFMELRVEDPSPEEWDALMGPVAISLDPLGAMQTAQVVAFILGDIDALPLSYPEGILLPLSQRFPQAAVEGCFLDRQGSSEGLEIVVAAGRP